MTEDQSYASQAAQRTGLPAVDAVLDAVDQAVGLPAEEQVAVFERAHEQLRRALDAPADAQTDVRTDGTTSPSGEPA
jgi:hypothetical protein